MPSQFIMDFAQWINNGEPVAPADVNTIGLLFCMFLFGCACIYISFFRKDELVEAYLEECRKEREKDEQSKIVQIQTK